MFELSSGLWQSHMGNLKHLRVAGNGASADVLVMYVFSNTDPQYLDNLKFFLREGVHAADGCDYLFIVNRSGDDEVSSQQTARLRAEDVNWHSTTLPSE